jgi:glycosyltransferase involved in cell wall biosynthesis
MKRKIKVLRIITRLNIGGPAKHVVLLTQGLNNDVFESVLACGSLGRGEGDMLGYALEKGVNLRTILELRREVNLLLDLGALLKIILMIIKEKPDIIHTHTAKAGSLGRAAGILYNLIPFKRKTFLVHTFHGHIFDGYFGKVEARAYLFIEKILAFFTDRIVAVSASVRDELISLGIADEAKIYIISLGLELNELLDINIPLEKKSGVRVGIIGRLVPVKNLRLFLDAALIVTRRNPDLKVRFVIAGDGELRDDLRGYAARLGLNEHVDFLGWQKELKKLYASLDIVSLTSLNEGTPVSLIEGMASARPIVATCVGGVKDLMGKEVGNRKAKSSGF